VSRWQPGVADIERLLDQGQLQRVTGGQMNGEQLLQKASRTLETASSIVEPDPDSAYVLAYDATRYACTALLAHQGLRPTSSGGHYAVEQAVRAQFGAGFRSFGVLRRRRNELEYPTVIDERASCAEALDAVESAQRIIVAATKLLDSLRVF
jgi:hypothetical protein